MDPKTLPPEIAPPHQMSRSAKLGIVAELLVRCFSNGAIERTLAAQWKVHERTVRSYIKAVHKEWARQGLAASSVERTISRVRNKAALEYLIAEQLAKDRKDRTPGDLLVVVQALKELNRMDGHHVKRVEHSGPGGGPIPHQTLVPSPERLAEMPDEEFEQFERMTERVIDMKQLPPAPKTE